MSDWKIATIDESCEILDSQRIPINDEQRSLIPGTIPYYGANGIQGYIGKFIFDEPLILLAEDGGNFDDYQNRPIAYRVKGKSWVNNHAHILRSKTCFSQDFVFYSLVHKNITSCIKGGTRSKLNQADLKEITFIHPTSLPEQRKIARILSAVDAVIEKTEAAIAKYKAIKSGMMRDLFTRGIDLKTGKLRPRYEDAPEFYKQSELGWVPKEWEVVRLGECSDTGFKYGINAAATEFTPLLPVYLRITDIDDDGHFIAKNKTSVNSEESKYYVLVDGDIVFARTGATVGKTYLYDKNDGELVFAGFLIKFNPNSNKLHPYYLKTYTETGFYKNWVIVYSSRSGQPGINGKEYAELLISLPKIEEQKQIVKSFISANKIILDEQTALLKYQQLKTALMSDLLTGKVRVKVSEP